MRISTLGGALVAATANDAISTAQAAADLGRYVSSPGHASTAVDTLRAARVLERPS